MTGIPPELLGYFLLAVLIWFGAVGFAHKVQHLGHKVVAGIHHVLHPHDHDPKPETKK